MSSPRRIIAIATFVIAAAASGIAASADDQPASTGHCAKSFAVSSPTTVSCSFRMSAPSHSFSGGGWEQPQDGTVVALWDMTMSVGGQPQPFNYCAGVMYSGCVTGAWNEDPYPPGTVVTCTVRAIGRGNFSCEATE